MAFSYAAAYLTDESMALFAPMGIVKTLHMTTCFDTAAILNTCHNVDFQTQTATIDRVVEWNTPSGVYLVIELGGCEWSSSLNKHFHALGALEDLPHIPHLTISKSENKDLMAAMQFLVGKVITFDRHEIKQKK